MLEELGCGEALRDEEDFDVQRRWKHEEKGSVCVGGDECGIHTENRLEEQVTKY